MADATAKLSNYRQAPRKVSLVADLVRGQRANHALVLLAHLPKRASEPVAKLIRSAIANARTKGMKEDELVISRVEIGKGLVMKRMMPRARGRGAAIRKKMTHITLTLSEKARAPKVKKASAVKTTHTETPEAATA